jgi:hypothetical protein
MTVSEVRAVMRRMWAQNSDALSLMYAQDSRLRIFGFGGGAEVGAFADAYNMFFLQVVPVAPNRVRPPSFLGEAAFEHPHNIALTRVRALGQSVTPALTSISCGYPKSFHWQGTVRRMVTSLFSLS